MTKTPKRKKKTSANFGLAELLAASGERMAADLRQRLIDHPGELGTEREEIVRRFLSSYLPKRFEISTGFAFDAAGHVSKQLDVIIADAQACPRFETVGGKRYYPCEAVVAVGQVRSSVTSTKVLAEALDNLESVKSLDRSANGQAYDTTFGETLAPKVNHLHQIFTFLFVTDKALAGDRVREELLNLIATRDAHLWPNVIFALDRYLVTYACLDGVCPNTMHARGIALKEAGDDASDLLMKFYLLLGTAIEVTRVSGLAYGQYLLGVNQWNASVWHSTTDTPPPRVPVLFVRRVTV
jgi:hypothetical protein